MDQCQAITQKNKRCKNSAPDGQHYCSQHEEKLPRATLWSRTKSFLKNRAWVISIATVTATAIGLYVDLGVIGFPLPSVFQESVTTPTDPRPEKEEVKLALLQRIDFDEYSDSPFNHGWDAVPAITGEGGFSVKHISDDHVANAISIKSGGMAGMEHKLGLNAAQLGEVVELVANFDAGSYFYVYVSLDDEKGNTFFAWLRFSNLDEDSRLYVAEKEEKYLGEWFIPFQQVSEKGGGWLLFSVNLRDEITQTWGKDGLRLHRIKKIRVRGNMSLDHVAIFGNPRKEQEP